VTSLKNKAYKNMLAKKNTKRAREEYQGGGMKKRKYIGGRRGMHGRN